jgi:predicted metal-dependent hydrolase
MLTDDRERTVNRAGAKESPVSVELPGGALAMTLRRSARARRLRVTVDPARGVIVTVPGVRRSERDALALATPFIAEREDWIRSHLARAAAERSRLGAGGPLGDGSVVRYRGEPHHVRVRTRGLRAGSANAGAASARRSHVERVGADEGDLLLVSLAAGERRALALVLEAWMRARARQAVDAAITRHAPALGVSPTRVTIRDTRSRWGSASRAGRLSFSWRLVLAPPDALETVVVHELAHLRVFGHGPDFWALVADRMPEHRTWRRWLRSHAAELHAALG